MRITKVTHLKHLGDYRLDLAFNDGTQGVADLAADVSALPRLVELRDKGLFAQAFLQDGTVCWSNDLDLAPEWLYARAHGLPPPRTVEQVEQNQTEMSLRALRQALGVTQQQLAELMQMTQSEVSRLEKRSDYHVSMIRRAVESLGGKLELVAVVGGKRVRLAM